MEFKLSYSPFFKFRSLSTSEPDLILLSSSIMVLNPLYDN